MVTSEGLPKICLHGSPNSFREFSYEFLGTSGTSAGYGFYFTDAEDLASAFSNEGGQLYRVYLRIEKPLNPTKKTITKASLAKFFKLLDPTGDDALSNYGDVYSDGYAKVLNSAVELEYSGVTNDVDLVSSIINASGMPYLEVYSILKQSIGYDGIITTSSTASGTTNNIYIVFSPNQIKSVDNNGNFSASNDIYEDAEYISEASSAQFAKRVATTLERKLKKIDADFYVIYKPSNSSVASNSQYIDIIYPSDLVAKDGEKVWTGLEGDIGDIKISDHFDKGYADYNYDVTGSELNKSEVESLVSDVISKMNIRAY